MKQQLNNQKVTSAYKKAVQMAYYQILKDTKAMLATIEQEELRFTLEREDLNLTVPGVIHELISPLLFLRLEQHSESLSIHWGIEQAETRYQLSDITSLFVRSLYKLTAKEATTVNVEGSVKTDWFIKDCSAMFDYIDERKRHHQFKQLKHKPAPAKRKQMQAVA